ncbi:hypothetical protein, partial [Enterobacter kobei]|uniref:hypothetical protein n=1 Tax=Enterobacter kobei TaxID=208224 RepID=UPI00298C40D1
KRAYCLKTQPATGETYPKSDLFNKAYPNIERYLISKQGYTHLERHKGWESESVFVQNLTTIYKPLFIAFPRNE